MATSIDFPSVRTVPWGPARWGAWGLMTLLATAIGGYAFALFADPARRPPFFADSPVPVAVVLHFVFGGLALILGPWQFLTGRHARRSAWHRWTGRAYVASCLLGIGAGFVLAPFAQTGPVARLGFTLLAVLTLGTTLRALERARRRDIVAHRRWMVRSYALILAAVTLRFQLPLSAIAGVPFSQSYSVIAWACWVPNLLVAEWWLRRRA